jgi:hypothetical protein
MAPRVMTVLPVEAQTKAQNPAEGPGANEHGQRPLRIEEHGSMEQHADQQARSPAAVLGSSPVCLLLHGKMHGLMGVNCP